MNIQEWAETAIGATLKFTRNGNRIELVITDADGHQSGQGWFKVRTDDHLDAALDRWFDVIVISQLDLSPQRAGLGTEVIRLVANRFPDALFVGENPNDAAKAWHANRLDRRFPTRMLRLPHEDRVMPGVELDSSEL